MNEYIAANRRNWDDRVPIHLASEFYDVASFKAGRSTLLPVELEELGSVQGKTLLHLQCHFGMDTLSWAREGAIVTGVDFSVPAIEAARSLTGELQIDARFIETDVYDLPNVLSGSFDIVFATYGVLCWLPDLPRWFQIAASFVKPGGILYLVDSHPLADMLADDEMRLEFPYLGAQALPFDSDRTYTDQQTGLQHQRTYQFAHGLGEIVTAAVSAGLQVEFLHEFTQAFFPRLPQMVKRDDGYYDLPDNELQFPFMFSLLARKAPA